MTSIREYKHFDFLPDPLKVLHAMQEWAGDELQTTVLLNSNGYNSDSYGSFPWLFAMGVHEQFQGWHEDVFERLKVFSDNHQDWLFGYFSYDLKNQLENLESKNPDVWQLPLCNFFSPVILIIPDKHGIRIGTVPGHGRFSDPVRVARGLQEHRGSSAGSSVPEFAIQPRVDKGRYLKQLKAIKDHIQAGDIYEMNYCIEFFAEDAALQPLHVYDALNEVSKVPFSCFLQFEDFFLMGSSPERFLKKQGRKIISQPIKGTASRGKNAREDMQLRQGLFEDAKERSENVMIVDLVRNDLSRSAARDSVKVEELFGVYPFRQVNHMVSTITSHLHPDCHYLDAIRHAFPMGSMTGAPKYRAMQLIDHYEDTRRGLYSGAVGYISPEKNFDFNVVIRSILYDRAARFMSYMAGSAITIGSVPEREYEECLLKARAMGEVAAGNQQG